MGIVASLLEIPLESPGRVMFVTAHPDDEAMFFVPVLQSLRAMQLHVMLLCMSNGARPSRFFQFQSAYKYICYIHRSVNVLQM